jgi:hypothetical protein
MKKNLFESSRIIKNSGVSKTFQSMAHESAIVEKVIFSFERETVPARDFKRGLLK